MFKIIIIIKLNWDLITFIYFWVVDAFHGYNVIQSYILTVKTIKIDIIAIVQLNKI